MERNDFDWSSGIIFLVILIVALAFAGKGFSNYHCKESSNNCEVKK